MVELNLGPQLRSQPEDGAQNLNQNPLHLYAKLKALCLSAMPCLYGL